MHIDPQRIRDAQSLLARHFGPTRIARAASLSSPGRDVFLKIETELPTGSFKVRGAIYALSVNLARDGLQAVPHERKSSARAPAITARRSPTRRSSSACARRSSCRADPNPVKAARIRALGARLVEAGARPQRRDRCGAATTRERASAFFLHDASDPDVPVGTATIGAEIVEQLPDGRRHLRADGRHRADPRRRVGREAATPVDPHRRRRRGTGAGVSPVVDGGSGWAGASRSWRRRRATRSPMASRSGGRWRRTSRRFASWWTRSCGQRGGDDRGDRSALHARAGDRGARRRGGDRGAF